MPEIDGQDKNTDQAYGGPIIDAHCHVASTQFIPEGFVDGVCRNAVVKLAANGVRRSHKQLVDAYAEENQDHLADGLIEGMDAAGISHSILLLPDFTYVMAGELTIEEMHIRHHTILQRHSGRFTVFAGVDPRWGRDGVDLFERSVTTREFKGLKLYPPCGYSVSDPRLDPYYEICRKYHLPVLTHIGPTSPNLSFDYSNPWQIDRAAVSFPDVNFILAHGAVHFVEECSALCAYRPNVYLDISAFLSSMHPGGWRVALAELFRRNINHKILFGTDWPVYRFSGGHKATMDEFLNRPDGPLTKVSSKQRGWIMAGNINRLLNEVRSATI